MSPVEQRTPEKDSTTQGSTGSASERRASLERFRAVGQSFADGLAALRSHVTSNSMPLKSNVVGGQPPVERDASFVSPPRGGSPNQTQSVPPTPFDDAKQFRRLSALLEASETRAEVARHEAQRVRRENEELRLTADRSVRLLSSLRAEYDRLVEERNHKTSKEEEALADTARLRTELVEVERQLQQMSQRSILTDRTLAEKKQKSQALERVCIGLRRRVAVAENKAQDASRMQEAIVARDTAESRLAETRAEAERLRARCAAVDVLKERADAAERAERSLRDKLGALEKEVESREDLLRQGLLERRRLKEYISKYERRLEEKDLKMAKLRRTSKRSKQTGRAPSSIETDIQSLETDPGMLFGNNDDPIGALEAQNLEVSPSRFVLIESSGLRESMFGEISRANLVFDYLNRKLGTVKMQKTPLILSIPITSPTNMMRM